MKPAKVYYSSYVKCDCCSSKVDPDEAKKDLVTNMIVCASCQPDFKSMADGYGERVVFEPVPTEDIDWEEDEKDYEDD